MSTIKMKSLTLTKAEGSEPGKFSGYLSTYGNEDRDGDTVVKGAFDDSIERKSTVPMLKNHNRDVVIGLMRLSSDDTGLHVDAELNMNDPVAKNQSDLIAMGALDSLSIGMAVVEYEPTDPQHPFGGWVIKKADVYEGSIVTIPANADALIESSKSLSDAERGELEELRLEKQFNSRKQALLAKFN